MTAFRSHLRFTSCLSLALGLATFGGATLWTTNADASGIGTARFGGEHGHPTTENATGIYYNPGAIALSKGTHIYVDGLIALRKVTYERPATAVSTQNGVPGNPNYSLDNFAGANDGKAKLFNVAGAPFIGATSDFGTDFVFGGLAAYVPFGGGATWGKNEQYRDTGPSSGAVDGQQRWYAIDGTIRSFYITGALGVQNQAGQADHRLQRQRHLHLVRHHPGPQRRRHRQHRLGPEPGQLRVERGSQLVAAPAAGRAGSRRASPPSRSTTSCGSGPRTPASPTSRAG